MIDFIIFHSDFFTHCFEIHPFLCRVLVFCILLLFILLFYVSFVKFFVWFFRRFFRGF